MQIISDLHIHSKYSRATSKQLNIENLEKYARIKGINLLGTGDFTHPEWNKELKQELTEDETGILKTKNGFPFVLQTEVSLIYTDLGKGRRIHSVILAPSFEIVDQITEYFMKHGRVDYDGRPIFKIPCHEMTESLMQISRDIEIIPAHCLPPDSLVHTGKGVIEISKFKKGDKVLTHKGRLKRIEKLYKRQYSGELIEITPSCIKLKSSMTPEHPVLAIKTYKKCKNVPHTICKPICAYLKRGCKKKKFLQYKPEWVMAQDLEEGDVILLPRFKETKKIRKINLKKYLKKFHLDSGFIKPRKKKMFNKNIGVKNEVEITERFCRLLGYYLAEGYIARDNIAFTFNKNERNYIDDVKKLLIDAFGDKINIEEVKEDPGAITIRVYSKILYEFFKDFYSKKPYRSFNKIIPKWLLSLPEEMQIEFLIGWWRGDRGYTASSNLINQFNLILLRLGIIPNINISKSEEVNKRRNIKDCKINGRSIKAMHDSYHYHHLSFLDNTSKLLNKPEFKRFSSRLNRRKGWIDDNYVYLPIMSIKKKEYNGLVYNLEVEEDNSYVTESLIVHNCWTPWFSLFGSMSGYDNINDAFKDQVKHIHALETGLSCYDKKTEVLTKDGWKKFSKIKYNDEICTLNIKTDKIEYQSPVRIFCYKYKGKMYRLKTKRIDLLVTPNHKLLVSHCDFRKPANFLLKKAEFMFNKSKRFKKNGLWKGKNQQYFILPAVKIRHGSRYYSGLRNKKEKQLPMKPWLKFFGFWIAEGWTTQGKNGDYNVCLSNNNKLLLGEMKKILKGFGYNIYHDDKINNTIRVRDYQLFHYLKQFGKSYDKHIPLEIKSLSKELLAILLKYYIKGDGHVYGRSGKGLSTTTSSIRLRDDLQEIALKIGISAYYKLHRKKGTPFSSPSQGKIYRQREDTWVVYFIRKNIYTVLPSTIKKYNFKESWINFDGNVFCIAVPNQVIYVRRNGIPVWCGNSDPAMNWRLSALDKYALVSFSDLHSFWPWRIGREATIFELNELTYKNLINALRTKEGLKETIEVNPSFGKYHLTGHRNCNVCLEPKKSLELKDICPKCGRNLTVGVAQRIEALADRPEGFILKGAPSFKTLIPLSELLSKILKSAVATKKVWIEYNNLIKQFGSEFDILLKTPRDKLSSITSEKISDVILANREGKIKVKGGFDGVYGIPVIDKEDNLPEEKTEYKRKQTGLDEFFKD